MRDHLAVIKGSNIDRNGCHISLKGLCIGVGLLIDLITMGHTRHTRKRTRGVGLWPISSTAGNSRSVEENLGQPTLGSSALVQQQQMNDWMGYMAAKMLVELAGLLRARFAKVNLKEPLWINMVPAPSAIFMILW